MFVLSFALFIARSSASLRNEIDSSERQFELRAKKVTILLFQKRETIIYLAKNLFSTSGSEFFNIVNIERS